MKRRSFTNRPIYERKCLELVENTPTQKKGLWICFGNLISLNGFKKTADVWTVLFEKKSNDGRCEKTALKQTFPHEELHKLDRNWKIDGCIFSDDRSTGHIRSKGMNLNWDVNWADVKTPDEFTGKNLIPKRAKKLKLIHNELSADRIFSTVKAESRVNEVPVIWNSARSNTYVGSGSVHFRSSIYAISHQLKTESGEPVEGFFEGLTCQPLWLGKLRVRPFSAFRIRLFGQTYESHSLKSLFRIRSAYDWTRWNFRIDQGTLSFRGQIETSIQDFAGITSEDTNGSPLYSAKSLFSNLVLLVYRRGKLEHRITDDGSTSVEIFSHERNPYVPSIL